MITEKSCGAIVYTKDHNRIQYVIIRSKEGIYGFPKGHMEGAESEAETALREVSEETGLTVRLIHGFRTEDSYTFVRNGETRVKQVVYFLGKFSNQIPIAQEEEVSSIHLMDYDSALAVFQFENTKSLLTQANRFLMQR